LDDPLTGGRLTDDLNLGGHLMDGQNRQKMVDLMLNYRGHLGALMDATMNYLQA